MRQEGTKNQKINGTKWVKGKTAEIKKRNRVEKWEEGSSTE